MCNVCCFDICMCICMCLHVIDSTTQELQEIWQSIFSLLLFVLQSCDLLTVGIALLWSVIHDSTKASTKKWYPYTTVE